MERATLIIPCFNEARRLDTAALSSLLDDDQVDLLFVDDGSSDATRQILDRMAAAQPHRIGVLVLERNSGKAEAVRRGLVSVIESGRSGTVGYCDADLATPPSEMRRLIAILRSNRADVLFGARVALLGHRIERSVLRHYLGRVFATLASIALRLPTYDTQCGAKLFRVTPTLADAVREPFLSRWAFDVELLGRLLIGSPTVPAISIDSVWEEPLRAWRDVKGSKLDPRQMAKALFDLARIDRDLTWRRARAAGLAGARPAGVPDREAKSDRESARAPR
jgi:glycosyltransferase involved in cell wall biosynthesis